MNESQSQCLLNQIESLRKKMIEITVVKGFTSRESIDLSKKLDSLLNQYEENKKKVL